MTKTAGDVQGVESIPVFASGKLDRKICQELAAEE